MGVLPIDSDCMIIYPGVLMVTNGTTPLKRSL